MSRRNVDEKESRGLYATPKWPVRLLLTAKACTSCGEAVPVLPGGAWLEPCAGEGSICYATNEVRRDVKWTAIEREPALVETYLEPARRRGELDVVGAGDFFSFVRTAWNGLKPQTGFEVVLGNPAFPDATRFALNGRLLAPWTILLERVDWLGGGGRADFWRSGLADVWVLPQRPRFRGRGTDSGEYAWFVWGPGTTGRVHHLPVVTREQMAEHRMQPRLQLGGA